LASAPLQSCLLPIPSARGSNRGLGMLVDDTQLWTRQQDDDEDLDEEVCEALARPMTASCVDAVLRKASDHCLEVEMPLSPGRCSLQEAFSSAGAAIVTPMAHAAATPNASAKKMRGRRGFGAMGTQAARGAEIARVLAAPRCPAEVREYAASAGGGFGRVPAFLRPVVAHLDAEQLYIISLIEPREAPRNHVRLLARGEKDKRLKMLQQQFQRASAVFSQAEPKSGARATAQAELMRLKEELSDLDRPYVFVAATHQSPSPRR